MDNKEIPCKENNYNNRYAFEWFMRARDEMYDRIAQGREEEIVREAKKREKKIAVFTAINTAISIVTLLVAIFS